MLHLRSKLRFLSTKTITFRIIGSDGKAYKGDRKLAIDSAFSIHDFIQKVKDQTSRIKLLTEVPTDAIAVYKNQVDFKKGEKLAHSCSISDCVEGGGEPLIVVLAPKSIISETKSSDLRDSSRKVLQEKDKLSQDLPSVTVRKLDEICVDDSLATKACTNPVWKEDSQSSYALERDEMFFVNRDLAIKELQDIHRSKFHRASRGVGANWTIPLADNIVGIGTSEFGLHYVSKSREIWKDVDKNEFQKTLCSCHTVYVPLPDSVLLTDDMERVILNLISAALRPMFVTPLPFLLDLPKTVVELLNKLTESCGPVFIVLDEIGRAFDSDTLSDSEKRKQFLLFCKRIVGRWLPLKNVFFLLLGQGSFLSHVSLRPTHLDSLVYNIRRLNIELLRPADIEMILRNTRLYENSQTTLKEYYELDDKGVADAASHLFSETNGHPLSLLEALQSSKSHSELFSYYQRIDPNDCSLCHNNLCFYKPEVNRLLSSLDSGSCVDLTVEVDNEEGGKLTLAAIAEKAFISWEGTVFNAKLYTHPRLRETMKRFASPDSSD